MLAVGQAVGDWAPGDAVMTYPVPLRDQGTWGAPAGLLVAAQHKLPAVYYRRYHVASGGLISYGYDLFDQYRRAAGYVDRILKGEKPADLPVQAPTRYELVINLKSAKAGLERVTCW